MICGTWGEVTRLDVRTQVQLTAVRRSKSDTISFRERNIMDLKLVI